MPSRVHSLRVLQNWDCHGCSRCCREYEVVLSEEEYCRILDQDWTNDPDLAGQNLVVRRGSWGARRRALAQRKDGACVFLSAEGRCKIHERFGAAAKPLACRLYPLMLIPAGRHWQVGLRFSCPSAARSQGRPLAAHRALLEDCATLLDSVHGQARTQAVAHLQPGENVDWSQVRELVEACLEMITNGSVRLEYRVRRWLAFARLSRSARMQAIHGKRLSELAHILSAAAASEIPPHPDDVPPPSWIGRVLFRQLLALYVRQDRGPGRGSAQRSRWALLRAAWRFARGTGPVPRVHAAVPERTFEQVEATRSDLGPEQVDAIVRYYALKLESMQFFGATNFGLPFWEGLESLALTFPALLWLTRALGSQLPAQEAVTLALSIVDNNFGFNPLLGTPRQRFTLRILARRGELDRLVAWYGR